MKDCYWPYQFPWSWIAVGYQLDAGENTDRLVVFQQNNRWAQPVGCLILKSTRKNIAFPRRFQKGDHGISLTWLECKKNLCFWIFRQQQNIAKLEIQWNSELLRVMNDKVMFSYLDSFFLEGHVFNRNANGSKPTVASNTKFPWFWYVLIHLYISESCPLNRY